MHKSVCIYYNNWNITRCSFEPTPTHTTIHNCRHTMQRPYINTVDSRWPPQHIINDTIFSIGERHCTHFFINDPQPAASATTTSHLCCVPFNSWSCDYEFTSSETVFHWPCHERWNSVPMTSWPPELVITSGNSSWVRAIWVLHFVIKDGGSWW